MISCGGSCHIRGNPNLDPEESTSYEIGLDQVLAYGFQTGLSAYYTKVDDLIASGSNGLLTNIQEATYQGGELYLGWQQDELFTKATYSYVKAQNEETNEAHHPGYQGQPSPVGEDRLAQVENPKPDQPAD